MYLFHAYLRPALTLRLALLFLAWYSEELRELIRARGEDASGCPLVDGALRRLVGGLLPCAQASHARAIATNRFTAARSAIIAAGRSFST